MAGKQVNQRIVIRLRRNQLDESRVLDDYDERSKILGRADHDYIRQLILIGHLFVSKIGTDISGKTFEAVALSSNDSDNTGKERLPSSSPNESSAGTRAPEGAGAAKPEVEEVVGSAIRNMAGIFGVKSEAS